MFAAARSSQSTALTAFGSRRFAHKKLDPEMFPAHKRFWDLEPTDLQTNPDSGLFLPNSQYRSAKPGELDLPHMDNHMMKLRTIDSDPMQLGIKPLTYGRVICFSKRAKVTRDDRVFSSAALIIGGNGNGVAGYGYGRGKNNQLALIDAEKKLHLNLQTLPIYEGYTIFHQVVGYFKRTVCLVRPAPDGRGLHGGKLSHGIMACFGIQDAYAKFFGQNNVYSQTKAIFKALSHVRSAEEFAMSRGRKLWELNRSWIDRPARFMEFEKPEKLRQYDEARMHEERVREVRKILVDMGRDEIEELLNTPLGLKAFVDMITTERHLAGEATPWTFDPLRSDASSLGSIVGGLSLDADFTTAVTQAQAQVEAEAKRDAEEDDDFENDEIIYHDKDLVDPNEFK